MNTIPDSATDRPRMTPILFCNALDKLGMNINDAARCWGPDRRRVSRWVSGEEDIPVWVPVLIDALMALGATKHALEHAKGATNPHVKVAGMVLTRLTGHEHPLAPVILRSPAEAKADETSKDMD